MPPKRARAYQSPSSDSEDEGLAESFTPSKRPRHDDEDSEGSSGLSSDEDDDVEGEDLSPEDEAAAEDAATQSAAKALEERRKDAPTENTEADGGIILSVEMVNFMCHPHLKVKFGPFMNFVIGHNGSGKSAILTALTLCLGGKATATSRGSSMKSFIKEGTDTAQITVRLKNGGDGFRTDQYGDEIIIERRFTLDGTSNYKLKSKIGRIISNKKQELDEICDFYALQVDNPLTILTQDLARQFLSTSTNEQKYTLFTKGVQLAQLDQDYEILRTGIKNTDAVLRTKKVAVQDLLKKAAGAKEKVDQLHAQEGLRERFQNICHQMAWVQVRDRERELEASQQKVAALEAELSNGEMDKQKAEDAYAEALDIHQRAQIALQEANEALVPYTDAEKEYKQKYQDIRAQLEEQQREERGLKGGLTEANARIAKAQEDLENEKKRLAERDGGTEALAEKQAAAQQHIDDYKERMNQLDQQHRADAERLGQFDALLKENKERTSAKESEIGKARETLQQLEDSQRNAWAAFPRNMERLIREIDREPRFRHKPVGPIGMHVTLLKQKWMHIVERMVSNLNGFVVTNHEDGTLLRGLMERCGCVVPYNVTPYREINPEEPDSRFDTIYRIIDVDDPIVRNFLIITYSIEQAILIESLDDANHVMGIKPSVANVAATGVAPIRPWQGASRMRMNDDGVQIQRARDDIDQLQIDLDSLQMEKRRLEQDQARYAQKVKDYRQMRSNLKVEMQRYEVERDEASNRIEEIAADGQISLIEARLKAAGEQKEILESQYESFIMVRDTNNQETSDLRKKLQDIKQDIALARKRIDEAEIEAGTTNDMREQALRAKNDKFDEIARIQNELIAAQNEVTTCQNRVETFTTQALEICPRVDVPPEETAKSMDAKLVRAQREVDRAEASLGASSEEILARYTKLSTEASEKERQMKALDLLLNIQFSVLKERRRRWVLFQRYISARARVQFTLMMSERGFVGRLRLEHKLTPPELIIEVQPGGDEAGNRGPKTLSGGEKSFSTICLLLSLWEAMGSPIRCLDEFDVYMDSINRQISVKMMIDNANRATGKQFILITPQNMDRTSTRNVKILRLSDPERNQSTLDT